MTRLRDLVGQGPRRGIQMPAWLERLVSIGIVSTDAQIVRRQRCTNIAAYAVIATALSHLVVNSIHNFHGLLLVNLDNLIIMVGSFLVPRLHRFGNHVGAITLVLLVLCGQLYFVWSFGRASELHVYFTLGGTMLLFFGVQNWRLFLFFFLLYGMALVVSLSFAPVAGLVIPWDQEFRDQLASQAMFNTMAIFAFVLFYALSALHLAEVELKDEHARSEALIATVMPESIAARLKSGREERIADRIETLTVVFADLTGFTAAAHGRSPEEVVDFLDSLVRALDGLCARHGVEKIKTIGDGYMAASGFDGDAVRGAIAAGNLALDMLEVVASHPPLGDRMLRFRIGIHSGPATAGVIGDTRFSYDIWGDAVNTASRMESHGEPGRIQVSEAFCALVADAFMFEERGETEIKGIGATRTYFLVAAQRE
jgi:adenylate cyclase